MPEMHLRQPGFPYSAFGPFTKNKERIQKFIQTRDKNDLGKDCFQHDMAYGKCKDLTKGIQSEKVFRGKAYEIASNRKHDGHQRGASMVFKFFDKKSKGSGTKSMSNQQLASKLHKPIIRKFNNNNLQYLGC